MAASASSGVTGSAIDDGRDIESEHHPELPLPPSPPMTETNKATAAGTSLALPAPPRPSEKAKAPRRGSSVDAQAIAAADPKCLPRPPKAKPTEPKCTKPADPKRPRLKSSSMMPTSSVVTKGKTEHNILHSWSESVQESKPIDIDDVEETDVEEELEDGDYASSKRKLTSAVWKEFKRVKYIGAFKAKCNYYFKKLGGETRNGTKHLHDHLKTCTLRKIKLNGNKALTQGTLRFGCKEPGKISLDKYIFDQDIAKKALIDMIVLHEYPLCMVDHAGFRRFVSALQPLFKMGTMNTIRKEIVS